MGLRRRLQQVQRHGAGRLTHHRDIGRIAAKRGDVALDPFQAGDLVHQPVIARCVMPRSRRQFGMRQVAEDVHPVGDAHEDHPLLGQRFPAIDVEVDGAFLEAAAMDPHHHRQLVAALGTGRRPDIGVKAILAGLQLAEIMVQRGGAQRDVAVGDLAVGIVDALPGLGRLRRRPAQLAHRRRGERHAQIGLHAAVQKRARQLAGLDGDGIARNRIHHTRLCPDDQQGECSATNQQATHDFLR